MPISVKQIISGGTAVHFDLSALTSQMDPLLLAELLAFVQVVFIDIVMAGDNAVAVGIAASSLPPDKRKQAITFGLAGAIATRVLFVILTVQLLRIPGLMLVGGLLLAWVCWRMWHDLRHPHDHSADPARPAAKPKTLFTAVTQILIADISMSLDNVLAVTGAAEDHIWVLAFGLLFSIAVMGVAANWIAGVLHKYAWIGYLGLAVVVFVAGKMIYEGSMELWENNHCDSSLKCVPVMAHNTVQWWGQTINDWLHFKFTD